MKEGIIVRYTEEELDAMHEKHGGFLRDLARVRAKTEAELEADIASDPDWADIPKDWYKHAVAVYPTPKKLLSIRLDADLVDGFKAQGPGYQTRKNAVLLAYKKHDQG
jgi:uncharacterized protein (DUF4415 family)